MSNFGIHLLPKVTRVTLFKYVNGGYLAWRVQVCDRRKTLNSVECLLHSQPSCGIIRTTANYFLLPKVHLTLSCPIRLHATSNGMKKVRNINFSVFIFFQNSTRKSQIGTNWCCLKSRLCMAVAVAITLLMSSS
jgi:hypothetical protein